ncbi:MAG: ABC transporter substrate-binding protein, partial [Anaerolineales bacterium]|nr:ABC transporter substrate-binding protein [Anaerolineales bacterium]
MKSLKKLMILVLQIVPVVLLAACASQENEPPLDEVTVQLKWWHQSQHAGFYAAETKGYYAEEGIAVTLIEGGPTIDTQASVLDEVA